MSSSRRRRLRRAAVSRRLWTASRWILLLNGEDDCTGKNEEEENNQFGMNNQDGKKNHLGEEGIVENNQLGEIIQLSEDRKNNQFGDDGVNNLFGEEGNIDENNQLSEISGGRKIDENNHSEEHYQHSEEGKNGQKDGKNDDANWQSPALVAVPSVAGQRPAMADQLTEEQIVEFKEVFSLFDKDFMGHATGGQNDICYPTGETVAPVSSNPVMDVAEHCRWCGSRTWSTDLVCGRCEVEVAATEAAYNEWKGQKEKAEEEAATRGEDDQEREDIGYLRSQIEVTSDIHANGLPNASEQDKFTRKSKQNAITNEKGPRSQAENDRMAQEASLAKEKEEIVQVPMSVPQQRSVQKHVEQGVEVPVPMAQEKLAEEATEVVHEIRALPLRSSWITITCSDLHKKEYENFYESLQKDIKDGRPGKHFYVEGQIGLHASLWLPNRAPFELLESGKKGGHLFKVFVRRVPFLDYSDELLPEWMKIMRGVVDSDLESDESPLKIPRGALQRNTILRKIKKNVIKKCLELLVELTEKNAEEYQAFYAQFGNFLKLAHGRLYHGGG